MRGCSMRPYGARAAVQRSETLKTPDQQSTPQLHSIFLGEDVNDVLHRKGQPCGHSDGVGGGSKSWVWIEQTFVVSTMAGE